MTISELLSGVKRNILLKNYTTFKIGGKVKYFFEARTKEDLILAIKTAKELSLPFFILAGGSNLLVSDKGYKGIIIKVKSQKSKVKSNTIFSEAGVLLSKLISESIKSSLTGLEWAAGIPGTVGGAIYGNAGAFGRLMENVVKSVEVLMVTDRKMQNAKRKMQNAKLKFKIRKFKSRECNFGYRDSIFKRKKNFIILSATFQLRKGNKKEIQRKIKEYLEYRKKNHPLNFPSAGCAFKNPKLIRQLMDKNQKLLKEFPEIGIFNQKREIPAGWFIEKCNLKGKKIGQAQISEKHANFIVNLGGARAKDVLTLINLVKKEVKTKLGILLEEEIQYLS